MNKVVNSLLSIDTFEQKHVVIKGMLQSLRLKDHTDIIGIDQSLINSASFEHKYLNNIKRYINILVSVTTDKNLRIFLSLLWFLL